MVTKLRNVHISGAKVGIKSDGPIDLDAENVTFDNVEIPYDIAGARSASIRGSRITNDPKLREPSRNPTMGWRRVNGPPLPIFCSNCKAISPSRNYNFGGQFFNLWDNEEPCPACGFEHARLSEGIFNLARETIGVLSAPDMTYVMLQALNGIANDLVAGRIDAETAVTKIENVSPELGKVAKKGYATAGKAAAWFIGIAISAVGMFYGIKAVHLAEEQVRIAQEQLDLQKRDINQDAILEEILKRLPDGNSSSNVDGKHKKQTSEGTPPKPAQCEPTAKAAKSKPKARHHRRAEEKARRNSFGRSRHR